MKLGGWLFPCVVVALAGCASHQPPKPVGDATSPRVGWVIMQGSSDNPDEEFVCQSNPRSACAVTASRENHRVFSEVHLYFHPVGAEARYQGTATIGFLGQGTPFPVNDLVKPDGVGNHSVVGIVTDKPGEYTLNIAVSATTPAGLSQLVDRVPITVN